MTDTKIDLTKLLIAGPMNEGSIDDHIETYPETGSGRYILVHRADFNVDIIPTVQYTYPVGVSMLEDGSDYHRAASYSKREWRKIIVVAKDLDRENAIKAGKEYAAQHNLPLYFSARTWSAKVIQKPEGWEPHLG